MEMKLLIIFLLKSFSLLFSSSSTSHINILLLQSSDINYNRQEWEEEEEFFPYTLVELSQIDVLNYASFHSYDYKRIKTNQHLERDLHPTWVKVETLNYYLQRRKKREQIGEEEEEEKEEYLYSYIVMLDLDIFFMNYSLSILDIINKYDPNHESLIYMPEDTNEENNYLIPFQSSSLILNVNTGFQIWKVNKQTIEIASRWKSCFEIYPNCQKWSQNWPFDQGAFNQFIRSKLLPNQLKVLPCDEGNGFPEEYENYLVDQNGDSYNLGNHNCHGRFVSHLWEETKRYNHQRIIDLIRKKYF